MQQILFIVCLMLGCTSDLLLLSAKVGSYQGSAKQWGKSTGQTTNFPIAFSVAALKGFAQYNETGNATGNADQTVTGLSKTSITTYRGYGYNYWVIGH